MDIYKPFISRPGSIQEPKQPWCTIGHNLWPASVSGSSSASSESFDPILDDSLTLHDEIAIHESSEFPLSSSFLDHSTQPKKYSFEHPIIQKKIRNVRKSNKYHCAVCGDKPTGYHYDVLSCNGCKTFFRRTIISRRKFSCSKGGKCQFTKAIQFSNKLEELKGGEEYEHQEYPTGSGSWLSTDARGSKHGALVPVEYMKSIEIMDMRLDEDFQCMNMLYSLGSREHSIKLLRCRDFPIFSMHSLREVLNEPSIVGKRFFNSYYNRDEQVAQYNKNPIRFWMVADLYLVVEYAKTLDCFKELNDKDQRILLTHAGGLVQIVSQAFYSYEQKSESLIFPDGLNALQFKLQDQERLSKVLLLWRASEGGSRQKHNQCEKWANQVIRWLYIYIYSYIYRRVQYEKYYRETYCRPVSLICSLAMKRQEFALFKAILLFSPSDYSLFIHDVDISCFGRAIIESEREKLTFTLRKILLKEYGDIRGTQRLAKILLAISTFMEITEKRRNYLEVCDLMATVQLSSLAKGVYLKQIDL
uniref:Nuclear receptor n=1 Tax=Heterorhabditis bacteriophora TaxID=37862 RepID=A0A1I7X587_HETBA